MIRITNKAAQSALVALVAASALPLAGVGAPSVAFDAGLAQVADNRDADSRAGDSRDEASPGAAQRMPESGRPSEDGTDDEADTVRPYPGMPDQPPGCRFRNGPLELVV